MLTALTIEDRVYEGYGQKFLSLLPVNSLKVQEREESPIHIRHLRYVNRNGRVDWKKISKKVQEGRGALLYSGKEQMPDSVGINLFVPTELRQRLCTNMALWVLEVMKDVPKKLRIGLYDPEGDCTDLPKYVLRYTDNLVVITRNYDIYSAEANRLLTESGAVLCVSPHPSVLSSCGFVISPCALNVQFTPMTKAVVLTSSEPLVSLPCRVYHRYSFKLPAEFEELRPEGIDAEVFAGGLYSLCGVHGLGALVPLVCSCNSDTQTALSLRRYLTECFGT